MAKIKITQPGERKSFPGNKGEVEFIEFSAEIDGMEYRGTYFDRGKTPVERWQPGVVVDCSMEWKDTDYGREIRVKTVESMGGGTGGGGGSKGSPAVSAKGIDMDTAIGVMAVINKKLSIAASKISDGHITYTDAYAAHGEQAATLWRAWLDGTLAFKKKAPEPEPEPEPEEEPDQLSMPDGMEDDIPF